MNKTKIEYLDCLKEMREACAACFRVIARHEFAAELEKELTAAGVEKGFGVRFQDLIAEIESNS